MKRNMITIFAFFYILSASVAFGGQGHSSTGSHGDTGSGHDAAVDKDSSSGHDGGGDASDHENMDHGSSTDASGNFKQAVMADGIHSEFQVMSLASMNQKDDQGNTHHIMVKMFTDDKQHQIKDAVGKIKVIGPDGKEQTNTLENYGGVLAANFSFPKAGKYGVICLAKVNGEKRVFKFWYPHK